MAVRRAYLENPVAQRAVRLVAEGIGGAPLLPVEPEIAALVGATSAGQPLLETLASHLLLHGNAYVQIIRDGRGRPTELFALRPERVSVIAGEDGWPSAYGYAVAGRQIVIPLLDEDAAPGIIHVRYFSPGRRPLRGRMPVCRRAGSGHAQCRRRVEPAVAGKRGAAFGGRWSMTRATAMH
ncbi:phage portal protein [Novosphingobium colocasiae]